MTDSISMTPQFHSKKNRQAEDQVQIPERLRCYIPVCEAIATLLAPQVEVVLHDLASQRIVHIANCFSRRRVGDDSLAEIDELPSLDQDVIGPYAKVNYDGRALKSITSVLRDPAGQPIGLLCINHDLSLASGLMAQLQKLVGLPQISGLQISGPQASMPQASGAEGDRASTKDQAAVLFANDWREQINQQIDVFLRARGLTLAALTRTERQELVSDLADLGFLEIRNAVPYLCDVLGISRATLYKWRKQQGG
ncbi:PAS domain-containing protein [Kiloniella laminariae]|uniref:PAS domain-containing protein n=1 Tax=Kiloniella laminariae TaxID=454162 RepID=A0ABT4LEY9_9PROT|nr:PAS domain-containing protein [Kiloniella laminariae]MCZ4279671.1 PAS domain-containing protein [Kiloniella laminariae]